MKRCLITGANRGIGLELARQLLEQGEQVVATARKPDAAADLQALGATHAPRFQCLALDVTSDESARSAVASLPPDRCVDLLINNAAVLGEWSAPLAELSLDLVAHAFDTNVLGPMRVTRALLPLLQRSAHPVVVQITSGAGSLALNDGEAYGYRISKAGLNMFNRTLALEQKGITCVALHPGWVRTEMGGANADIGAEESAAGLLRVIAALTPADSGRFLDYRGQALPW